MSYHVMSTPSCSCLRGGGGPAAGGSGLSSVLFLVNVFGFIPCLVVCVVYLYFFSCYPRGTLSATRLPQHPYAPHHITPHPSIAEICSVCTTHNHPHFRGLRWFTRSYACDAPSFSQQPSISQEAKLYCQRYHASGFPHMSLVDPRTGMKVSQFVNC